MKKRTICTLMATVLWLSTGMTAFAAPETMPDGGVFDAEYYAETYSDVKAIFGDNKEALYNHYLQFGKAEGRMAYEFGDAMEMQNTVSTGVKLEASDENYLKAAYIALGGIMNPERNTNGGDRFVILKEKITRQTLIISN